MAATIDREFGELLLRAVDDPQQYGVHQLFNDWWRFAPEEAKERYLARLEALPGWKRFVEERHYADPLTLEELAARPEGSVGRSYHDFLVTNGLEKNLAIQYRRFHELLAAGGILDAMPEVLQYAVIRGFQLHDFQHVVTGYDSSRRSELALQAFCLAQLQFPYFAMWMSVSTTRMTFLDPDAIVPVMDAISEGWRHGRRVRNLQFEKLETLLDDPLGAVRERYGIAPGGLLAAAAA